MLFELPVQELLSGPLISMDETRVQVLNEPERSADSKSYMWVFRGGIVPWGTRHVLFRYSPSRGGNVAREFIGDYSGYDFLDGIEGIIHVGCRE